MRKVLVAIPVYNEEKYINRVMGRVLEQSSDVLVIDDGSTDSTPCMLPSFPVEVIRHSTNRGYGRSLQDAFRWAAVDGYDWVITMDCDDQHEPAHIPAFMDAIEKDNLDIISGSRYLNLDAKSEIAPADRRAINMTLANEINDQLGFTLTDAFCGFKAHRVSAMQRIDLTEDGYAFPMQLWAQAAAFGLRVGEIEVDLIYNDPNRTFGGGLDDSVRRLAHYREVLSREIARAKELAQASASTSRSTSKAAHESRHTGCRCC